MSRPRAWCTDEPPLTRCLQSAVRAPLDAPHSSHAIESPDAQSAEAQSRKSESFALDALSEMWTRDRAGGTTPRRLRASPMPQVQNKYSLRAGRKANLYDDAGRVDHGAGIGHAVDLPSDPP